MSGVAAEIAFDRATKRYPGRAEPAVRELTLTVPAGQICCLVGPSGAGKTTAMKMVNRLIDITEGDITIGGVSFNGGIEFYSSARIGSTAFTYQHASWGDVALYPKAGLMGQAELGLRGETAFISIYTETMAWGESDIVRDWRQPNSELFTLGLKAGFSF